MTLLKPTVQRDISLFSAQAWQKGYQDDLLKFLGWSYPVIFYYDGFRVNFYHLQTDFVYFKETITPKLIRDDQLFQKLNTQFVNNIEQLKEKLKNIDLQSILSIYALIGEIMSFYVFVVSDTFLAARSEAERSRTLSEGILYEADLKIETYLQKHLPSHQKSFAHFLSMDDIQGLITKEPLNISEIKKRQKGYIVRNTDIITNLSFDSFCKQQHWSLPKNKVLKAQIVQGKTANHGNAQGRAVIVRNKDDFDKVRNGDIIIAVMTNITYTSIFKRAAAVVTDEGGVLCHAAILARELNIPCVVGTSNATQVFKDRDFVILNTAEGLVKKTQD